MIICILFSLSLILYLKSLKGCFLSIERCAEHTRYNTYFKLGVYLILSSVIFGLLIFIQIILKSKWIYILLFLLIYFIIFYLTKGTDFAHHGTYNSIIFFFFFPVFTTFFYIIYLILYFCFKFETKNLLILILICIYIILIFISNTNCNRFYDGIGGEKLINNKELDKCFIKKPRSCGYDFLSGLFDANIFRKKGCEGFNEQKQKFLQYLDKNLSIYDNFSYPRTENWDSRIALNYLANLVEKEIKPANINNSKDNEVFVSFKENKGKITINLKKNETLIIQKRKLAEKYDVKFHNVYLIFFDSFSRNHFMRKLKKSTKIIEKLLFTNKRKEKRFENFNSFQFFKYHSFNEYTKANLFPLFFGNTKDLHRGISLIKYFNEKGFITAASHNSCNKALIEWPDQRENITFSKFDHENVAMFCDTNYENKFDKYTIIGGKSSVIRRCFYGRDSFEYIFEYILQFLDIYKNERKFFRISFEDGHEATTEVIKYIDNSLSSFLQKILNNYFDSKTALLIFSDHGAGMPGPFDILFYEEKTIEKYLGLLIIILPNLDYIQLENILFNQQIFITSYDIHDTLFDMININKSQIIDIEQNKGQSLFLKINGKQRSCKNYIGQITDNFCFCENYVS